MSTSQRSFDDSRRNVTDVDFSVAFRHRLRFTHDILGSDSDALADLLESSEGRIPRVQFWLDEHVSNANPDLKQRLHSFARRNTERFQAVGNPQIVPGGESVKNDIHILERMLKVFHVPTLTDAVTSLSLVGVLSWMPWDLLPRLPTVA